MVFSLLLVLAAGTQSAARPLTPVERTSIERAVREQLNDPASATFRHNPFRSGAKFYCGRVNAKNRFGGYVGYRIFSVNVRGGKGGALPADGSYGSPTILGTDNQHSGDATERLLFMLTEAKCNSEGYQTGYAPVKQ